MKKTLLRASRMTMLGGLALAVMLLTGAKGSPPDISEIVGTWDAKVSGSTYLTDSGVVSKVKQSQVLVITQTGVDTVTIGPEGEPDPAPAYYDNGLLIIAQADDSVLASEFNFSTVMISGSNGKLKMTGDMLTWVGDSDNMAVVGKLKAKRRQDPT